MQNALLLFIHSNHFDGTPMHRNKNRVGVGCSGWEKYGAKKNKETWDIFGFT